VILFVVLFIFIIVCLCFPMSECVDGLRIPYLLRFCAFWSFFIDPGKNEFH